MSDHVFVVSEWLPKKGQEEKAWQRMRELMAVTRENEPGCIRAHATRQIAHPGSPGKSKYTIVLLQEYVDVKAFDLHCQAEYVQNFVKASIETPETAIIEEGRCRLFSDKE